MPFLATKLKIWQYNRMNFIWRLPSWRDRSLARYNAVIATENHLCFLTGRLIRVSIY